MMNIEDIFERENIDKQHTVKHICITNVFPHSSVLCWVWEKVWSKGPNNVPKDFLKSLCLFGGFKFLTTKDWRKNFLSTVTFPSSLLIKFTKSKEIYHTLASLSTTSSIIVVKSSVDTFLKTNHILNYNSMSCYFPHPQKTSFTASSSFHISCQNVFMTEQQCERDDHLPKI